MISIEPIEVLELDGQRINNVVVSGGPWGPYPVGRLVRVAELRCQTEREFLEALFTDKLRGPDGESLSRPAGGMLNRLDERDKRALQEERARIAAEADAESAAETASKRAPLTPGQVTKLRARASELDRLIQDPRAKLLIARRDKENARLGLADPDPKKVESFRRALAKARDEVDEFEAKSAATGELERERDAIAAQLTAHEAREEQRRKDVVRAEAERRHDASLVGLAHGIEDLMAKIEEQAQAARALGSLIGNMPMIFSDLLEPVSVSLFFRHGAVKAALEAEDHVKRGTAPAAAPTNDQVGDDVEGD